MSKSGYQGQRGKHTPPPLLQHLNISCSGAFLARYSFCVLSNSQWVYFPWTVLKPGKLLALLVSFCGFLNSDAFNRKNTLQLVWAQLQEHWGAPFLFWKWECYPASPNGSPLYRLPSLPHLFLFQTEICPISHLLEGSLMSSVQVTHTFDVQRKIRGQIFLF